MKRYLTWKSCIIALVLCAAASNAQSLYNKELFYRGYRIGISERVEYSAPPAGRAKISITPPNAKHAYSLQTGRLDPIQQVWVRDLLRSGRFEVIFATKSPDEGKGKLYLYEWTGRKLVSVNLPRVNEPVMMGYRGRDRYSIAGRTIVWEFPVYQEGDTDALPTGGTRIIRYNYRGGKWVISVRGQRQDEFFATGVEPFWSLNILRGKVVRFNNVGQQKVYYFPYAVPKVQGKSWIYQLSNKNGVKMTVIITQARCYNDMSGRTSAYSARVTINGAVYKGCAEK